MKYPTPTTIIHCVRCGLLHEIELMEKYDWHTSVWYMPKDWDDGWTVNEDGDAICPKHQEAPK